MIRFLLWLAFVTGLGIAAAWVAETPGEVTMVWLGWRIDTSFAFLFFFVCASAFFLAVLTITVRRLMQTPAHVMTSRRLRHVQRGLGELTYGVAALAAGDVRHAERHTRKAEKSLGKTPLVLLLSAQVARSQGDDAKTRALLEEMLKHKETEYLATRSLSDAAGKQQLFPRALSLAQRANEINPKDVASVVVMIGLHVRLSQWAEALAAADRNAKRSGMPSADRHRYQGLVHLKQGMALLAEGKNEQALAHARSALRLLPSFVPAISLAADAFAACGQPEKAAKLITQSWKRSPHPELAARLRVLVTKEPKEKQLKRMRALLAAAPDNPESALALAQTAAMHKEWETARKAAKAAMMQTETARACRMMAEIDQGEFSDYDAAGKWLAKSAVALPDPAWACSACNHHAEHWDAHCTSCGAFDTVEWK